MLVFLAATGICFNGIQEASPREKLWDYERFGQRLILYASVFSAIFFIISVYIIFSVFSSDAATHPGLEASIVLFVRNTSVMLKPLMPVVLIIICYNLTGPLCRHDVNITLRLFLIFSALWLIVSIMETVVFAHQLKAVPVFMFIMNISIGGLTIITSGLLVFYTKLYMKYNGGKIKKGEPYNPYL
jgi:magnesium-transporting ATPase (P-type)